MSFQNPVFIPGPTNMPESVRKACDMPTLDHRSPAFARLFKPAVAGVRRVLKMAEGEVIVLPSNRIAGCSGDAAARRFSMSARFTVFVSSIAMRYNNHHGEPQARS